MNPANPLTPLGGHGGVVGLSSSYDRSVLCLK